MLVTLPADIAARLGATEADVYEDEDDYAFWHVVVDGVDRRRDITLRELDALAALAVPPERAPEPGRPLKRGERPRGRRSYGEPFSARRTGRYAAMMHRGTR